MPAACEVDDAQGNKEGQILKIKLWDLPSLPVVLVEDAFYVSDFYEIYEHVLQ